MSAPTVSQYDPVAESYERWIVPKFRVVAEALAAFADPREDADILEVGAGTGGLSRHVVAHLGARGRLTVTDVSAGMLAVARRVVPAAAPARRRAGVAFQEADLARLPFHDGRFDMLLSQFTPLLDAPATIREAARVLRPGGRLVAAIWGLEYGELTLLNAARRDAGIGPYPAVPVATLLQRLRRAGFHEIETQTRSFEVSHDDVEAYLVYRSSFGAPTVWSTEVVERYRDAFRSRVEATWGSGPVVTDWRVRLIAATRR